MMSLWVPKATLKVQGNPESPYVGTEQLREFWLHSGSFKNRRFPLVPSFKTRIRSTIMKLPYISSATTWLITITQRGISSTTHSWPERFGTWARSGCSMT